ncbi:MAG: hypothetical protein VX044_08165 [Planctomycetota bacterium]|nr:hypothetical protein [Planctomycetota bacterium]
MSSAPSAAAPLRAPRRAATISAATLRLPCLAPALLGLLRDSSYCVSTYFKLIAVVPGVRVPVLMRLKGACFGAAGGAVTMALLLGLYHAARWLPSRWLHALLTLVMALVVLESIGLVYALRM